MTRALAETCCACCGRPIPEDGGRFALADGTLCTSCYFRKGGHIPEADDLGPQRSIEELDAMAAYFDDVLAATPVSDVCSVEGSLATYASAVRTRHAGAMRPVDEETVELEAVSEGFRDAYAVSLDVPRISVGFDDALGLMRTIPLEDLFYSSQLVPYGTVLRFDVIEDTVPGCSLGRPRDSEGPLRICTALEIDVTTSRPTVPLSTIRLIAGPVAHGGATYLRARLAARRIAAKLRQIVAANGRAA